MGKLCKGFVTLQRGEMGIPWNPEGLPLCNAYLFVMLSL